MNTNPHPWLRAALLALIATPLAVLAAVQEIPITTTSAEARLAFDAGLHGRRERGDTGHVQRPRPDVALLPAAVQQRCAGHVATAST